MIHIASQFQVAPDQLAAKTAEMINAAVFFTAAAQRPPKQVKFDFFYMHSVNASAFWPTLNALPWLGAQTKCRLLEWKGRQDLVMYASRRSPKLLPEEIARYVPKDVGAGGSWKALAGRLYALPKDDGHAVKLLRTVALGERVCAPFEGEEWARVKAGEWLKIGNMVVDSVEDAGGNNTWVRGAGFAEAWENLEDAPRKVRL